MTAANPQSGAFVLRSLDDIIQLEQTPLSARDLPESTYELVRCGAAINPEKFAIRYVLRGTHFRRSHDITYRELMQHITRAANMFSAIGVGGKDVISVMLPNMPQTYSLMIGAETAGIVNPVNPLLEPQVIAEIMNACESKVLVTLAAFPKSEIWQKVAHIAEKVPTLETVLTVNLGQFLPQPLQFLVNLAGKNIARKTAKPRQPVLDADKLMAQQSGDSLTFSRKIDPQDIASYFHTGGTTGIPKLAPRSHFNEVVNAWAEVLLLENAAEKTVFCGLPLFHNGGFNAGTLGPLSAGVTLVVGSPAGYRGPGIVKNFWKIAAHYRLNSFIGVPAVFAALLNVPVGNANIRSLEYALCGAAMLPTELFHRFEAHCNLRIVEGYGLTEATSLCTANMPYGERKIGSIGLRFAYQEIKVVQLDDKKQFLRECAADENGTIIVRGPNIFPGYKLAVHNSDIWVDTGDGNGNWLNTGDLGHVDPEGFFFITGRQKEVIIRGGHNIDAKLIEEPLSEHPAVAMAAAIGRPDPVVGEVPVAYVQLSPGKTITETALLDFVKLRIGERAAIPKKIHIIDPMPLTAVGKIFKPALVHREIRDVFTAEIRTIECVNSVDVIVGSDMVHGTVAAIKVLPANGCAPDSLKSEIARKLGNYAIHFELEILEMKYISR